MNLKEIVLRDDSVPISTDESLFVIKEYIKIRKSRDVNLKINTEFGSMFTAIELNRMVQATTHAIMWLRMNQNKL